MQTIGCPEQPLKIGVIGAGWHSRASHLPALVRCVSERPDGLNLAAVCDIDAERAREAAEEFGFERAFSGMDEMLEEARPDAVVAVTPVEMTAGCALKLIERGIPALIEKPPGASVEEAQRVAEAAAASHSPVMVSMNRRFDPALAAAVSWMEGGTIRYARGSMLRAGRSEPAFMTNTALHALDALRAVAGDVTAICCRNMKVKGTTWYDVALEFENGARGALEIMPTAGVTEERYDLFGDGWRVVIRVGGTDCGTLTCWEGGEREMQSEPAEGEPGFVRDGTYAETREFLHALIEGRSPRPTPQDVLQSVELCHECAPR